MCRPVAFYFTKCGFSGVVHTTLILIPKVRQGCLAISPSLLFVYEPATGGLNLQDLSRLDFGMIRSFLLLKSTVYLTVHAVERAGQPGITLGFSLS